MIRGDFKALEQLLSTGDGLSADGSSPGSSAITRAVAEIRSAASALARDSEDEKHLTLEELQDHVDNRRELGHRWQMPEHLARCGLCLEAFELLLAGVPRLSAASFERFVALKDAPSDEKPVVKLPAHLPTRFWRYSKLLAAATVLLAAALWVLGRDEPVHVRSGTVATTTGEPSTPDRSLPEGKHLVAEKGAEATFADGSKMLLAAGSKFVLRARSAWRTTVELEDGTADFSVAKQPAYRQFRVHTGLGDVIVVGTRFRVMTGRQEVDVFRNTHAAGVPVASRENRQIMVVTVEEGRVRVKNAHEEITLTAGQKATVREDQPKIDIVEGS